MIPVATAERDALDDVRGKYGESLHYALEGAYVRLLELHQQLEALERKVSKRLNELDERTVGSCK